MPLGSADMEWVMLLVAAALAAAAVTAAHTLGRRPRAAMTGARSERQIAEERAVHAVEADAGAAREAAEELSQKQRVRG